MSPGFTTNYRTLAVICLGWIAVLSLLQLYLRPERFVRQPRYAKVEQIARDWLTTNGRARPSPQNPRLVYLGIDESTKTLDTIFSDEVEKSRALQLMKQGFPWDREVYALIIDRLAEAGASAVIFDMLFPNPRAGDKAFHEALDKWRDRVVIGVNFQDRDDEPDADQVNVSHKGVLDLPTPALRPPDGQSWIGFVNLRPDDDQICRHVPYRTTLPEFFGTKPIPGTAEYLSLAARGLAKAGAAGQIPKTREQVMIRFCPVIQPRPLQDIFDAVQWAAPPYDGGKFFRDKIVLIGAAGNQTEDRLTTPFGTVPGPAIHLAAMNAALNGDFIRVTELWENVALVCAAGLLAWFLGRHVAHRILRLLLLFGLLAGFYAGAQWIYNATGLLPILVGPMLVLSGSGITWTVFEQAVDLRERRRVRQTFEKYVSPDVVREILDNPATFLNSLGGERRNVTVLFSDIRGFTTLTESADPQVLVTQLNEYFKEMVATVFAHEGTLDKFIGDAVMAHWGSLGSASEDQNALRSIRAALDMRKALVRLNEDWKPRGLPALHIGIGINHGPAIAGNIGASGAYERFDFTVLGDAVNLASRLEGVTKEYGLDLCLGEDVEALVRDAFVLRSVDFIRVKGKTRPAKVFTIVQERTAQTAEPAWLAQHEQAMRAYRAGDFLAAETGWLEVISVQPDDPLAPIFLARCAQLIANPPGQNWTGVFEMLSK